VCTRELDGEAVEFGTTGYTMDNVFVLYDRASDSVWYPTSDESLEAVSGKRQGDAIEILDEPAPLPLGEWLDTHPDSLVLLPSEEDLERMRRRRNRPYMGVQLGEHDGGLFLDEVMADTPAEAAGFENGDRIVSIGGVAVDARAALGEVISEHAIGDTVDVVVLRKGRELTLSLTFGSRE
jgi:predicted metalloprotease with PDZ domain